MPGLKPLIAVLLVGVCSSLGPHAFAQAYPTRSVHIVVPYPPGGAGDLHARLIGSKLSPLLGQPVVIENRAGASGNIGSDYVAKSAPDGHTLLMNTTNMAIARAFSSKLPFNVLTDLAPISMSLTSQNLLVVKNSLPVNSVKDLIAHAKANPGKLSYGVTNVAFLIMVGQWLNKLAGTDMVGVTYKGAGQQMQDIAAGRIQWILAAPPQIDSFVRAGKLRVIAVDGVGRYAKWPDVPSIAETFPGYRTSGMGILIGPRGIPANVVQSLNGAMDKINRDPEYQARLLELSIQIREAGNAESISAFIRERRQYWAGIFKALNVQRE